MSTAGGKNVGGGIVEASVITHSTLVAALVGAIGEYRDSLSGPPHKFFSYLTRKLVGTALSLGGMTAVKFSGLRAVLEALLFSTLAGLCSGTS